ncbi:MAG: benzoate/H(+) symporter BenE family transporter [Gammaproteobacteria bacterium]|nr:benzoate/H(+) symporter BenE family transporter [Gammaproteobacteria bacterium]
MQLFNISHFSAGFIAVLVGYTSSVAIILQAADAVGASAAQKSSWLWALGLGMSVSTIALSLRYKKPVLTAWSTPGAALLVSGLSGLTIEQAIGAFLFSSVLITVAGFSGGFAKIMHAIPHSLASAMLAGVLLPFGLKVFGALESQFTLVAVMLLVYLSGRRLFPRYAIPLVLLSGLLVAGLQQSLHVDALDWQLAKPVWVTPAFSWQALLGVGLPLFIVTMASQNVPGLATLSANGYSVPVSPLIGWTGLTGLALAPFGGFAFNLAAITAAICQGEEADPDPRQRYLAAIWAGLFYALTGAFAASVVGLFAAFPEELVFAIAGLALLGTIGNSLADSLSGHDDREAALLTFMITASGLSLFGIGSAFWGLVVGGAVWMIRSKNR